MKSKGLVRNIDDLGRFVVPMEIRRTFNISPKDGMEILTDGENIIFRKMQIACTFCGSQDNLKRFEEKMICEKCVDKISKIV